MASRSTGPSIVRNVDLAGVPLDGGSGHEEDGVPLIHEEN
jgi:hypothetical protein